MWLPIQRRNVQKKILFSIRRIQLILWFNFKKQKLSWLNLTSDLSLGTPKYGRWFLDGSDLDVRLV